MHSTLLTPLPHHWACSPMVLQLITNRYDMIITNCSPLIYLWYLTNMSVIYVINSISPHPKELKHVMILRREANKQLEMDIVRPYLNPSSSMIDTSMSISNFSLDIDIDRDFADMDVNIHGYSWNFFIIINH